MLANVCVYTVDYVMVIMSVVTPTNGRARVRVRVSFLCLYMILSFCISPVVFIVFQRAHSTDFI